MSILQNKQDIATHISNNWTETPIHWYGLEFDYSSLDEWIFVAYQPLRTSNNTLDDSFSFNSSILDIDILARKENRTFEIYDLITSMLSVSSIGNNLIKSIDIDGKDLISTDNGDYRVLSIAVYLRTL